MLTTALLLIASSFAQASSPAVLASMADETAPLLLQDHGETHTGFLQGFVTNDTGTYLIVNERLYRLPPGTPVPPYGVRLKLRGVTRSETADTDYYATSVAW